MVGCRFLVVAAAAVGFGVCGSWLQDGVAGSGPCRGKRNGLPLVVRGLESWERIIGAATGQNATITFWRKTKKPTVPWENSNGGWRCTTLLPGQLRKVMVGYSPQCFQTASPSPRKRLYRLVGWRVAPGDSRIKQSVGWVLEEADLHHGPIQRQTTVQSLSRDGSKLPREMPHSFVTAPPGQSPGRLQRRFHHDSTPKWSHPPPFHFAISLLIIPDCSPPVALETTPSALRKPKK